MHIVWMVPLALAGPGPNLVPNGDFEGGKEGIPASWQRPDGLTSFWVDAPGRKGKCIKLDSDVLQAEYLRRREEMKQENPPPAKPKSPTREPKYDTVAGGEGVGYYTDYIPADPKKSYRLTVSFRGEGALEPMVFVKGYFEDARRPEPYRRRAGYEKYLKCPGGKEWKTFSMVFQPRHEKLEIRWIRVELYAYWPPGTYYFDDVRVEEVPPGEGGTKKASGKA